MTQEISFLLPRLFVSLLCSVTFLKGFCKVWDTAVCGSGGLCALSLSLTWWLDRDVCDPVSHLPFTQRLLNSLRLAFTSCLMRSQGSVISHMCTQTCTCAWPSVFPGGCQSIWEYLGAFYSPGLPPPQLCMYVCMYVRTYVHIYTYMYVCVCVHTYRYVCVLYAIMCAVCTCVYTCVHVWVVCAHMHVHVLCVWVHVYVCACVWICIVYVWVYCVCACICVCACVMYVCIRTCMCVMCVDACVCVHTCVCVCVSVFFLKYSWLSMLF